MPQQEANIPKDRPTLILEGILGNKRTLGVLLSQDDAREDILDKASLEIAALDARESGVFVGSIFNGLSRDDDQWDINRRDGALELLPLVDFTKVRGEQLAQSYSSAVASQNADSDPYASIYALLEAGKMIAHYLPPGEETRSTIGSTWDNVATHFKGEDRDFIEQGKTRIVEDIPLHPEDLIGDPDMRLGWREQPKFEGGEKTLHDKYVEVTNSQRTFKLALWDNTPQFRATCSDQGVDLERFWNISNPDQIVTGLQNTDWQRFPQTYTHLNRALQAESGIEIPDLSVEHARVLSDEIVRSAAKARDEILGTVGDFETVIGRFRGLLDEVQGKGGKAQRAVSAQVANFLRENGISSNNTDLQTILAAINDNDLMTKAREQFDQKQQAKVEGAEMLTRSFALDSKPTNYSLISRQREDLFLGDLTGDCTAYHLHTGMNAWTVPVWLSNPGFNFYKITDGDKLVAKLGILLAAADERPVIVVDSFEVATGISDQEAAKQQIRGGLRFLREWAAGIGLDDVFVNTVSNSSGAVDLLQGTVSRNQVSRMSAIGGLSGVSEIRQRLTGEKSQERIYLQAQGWDFEDEEDDETREQARLTQEFEQLVSGTISRANNQDARTKIEGFARSQNWSELFGVVMELNYPTVSQSLGKDWNRYKQFMDLIEVDDTGNAYRVDSDAKYYTDEFPIQATMEEQVIEEAARQGRSPDDNPEDDQRLREAQEADNLLVLIKQMEKEKLTPEMILKKLYGQTVVARDVDIEDAKKLGLNRRLPRLVV